MAMILTADETAIVSNIARAIARLHRYAQSAREGDAAALRQLATNVLPLDNGGGFIYIDLSPAAMRLMGASRLDELRMEG